jgi:hypothetical protein
MSVFNNPNKLCAYDSSEENEGFESGGRTFVDTERGVNQYQVQFKTFSTYT